MGGISLQYHPSGARRCTPSLDAVGVSQGASLLRFANIMKAAQPTLLVDPGALWKAPTAMDSPTGTTSLLGGSDRGLMSSMRVSLHFEDIGCDIQTKQGPRTIIAGVSGAVEAGQMVRPLDRGSVPHVSCCCR